MADKIKSRKQSPKNKGDYIVFGELIGGDTFAGSPEWGDPLVSRGGYLKLAIQIDCFNAVRTNNGKLALFKKEREVMYLGHDWA